MAANKDGYWHLRLGFNLQRKILKHFYEDHDNRDAVIAKRFGLRVQDVQGFLREHCNWKERRLNQQINERYEARKRVQEFQRNENVRLLNLVKDQGGE